MKLTDNDLMPYGKYKGDKMINVPASYLLWICDNGKCHGAVMEYIRDNYPVLLKEIENNK